MNLEKKLEAYIANLDELEVLKYEKLPLDENDVYNDIGFKIRIYHPFIENKEVVFNLYISEDAGIYTILKNYCADEYYFSSQEDEEEKFDMQEILEFIAVKIIEEN